MTLKELGACTHVRRGDRIVEFKKGSATYNAICPQCGSYMRWDNWPKLSEPLRAQCIACKLMIPSTELCLLPDNDPAIAKPVPGIH